MTAKHRSYFAVVGVWRTVVSVNVCTRGYLRNHTTELGPICIHVILPVTVVGSSGGVAMLRTSGFVDDVFGPMAA